MLTKINHADIFAGFIFATSRFTPIVFPSIPQPTAKSTVCLRDDSHIQNFATANYEAQFINCASNVFSMDYQSWTKNKPTNTMTAKYYFIRNHGPYGSRRVSTPNNTITYIFNSYYS
jgi:hypothetical protein